MKYTKKLMKSSGGIVVRVPSDIIKVLNLTENDYVEIDISKIDLKEEKIKK
jgi:antitoxin component of MazEF toxin-antitoxin module